MSRNLWFLAFVACLASPAAAQKDDVKIVTKVFFRVHLKNGNTIDGRSFKDDPMKKEVTLRLLATNGELILKYDELARNDRGKPKIEEVRIRERHEPVKEVETDPKDPDKKDPDKKDPDKKDPDKKDPRKEPGKTDVKVDEKDIVKPDPPITTSKEVRDRIDALLKEIQAADVSKKNELAVELGKAGAGAPEYLADLLDRVDAELRAFVVVGLQSTPEDATAGRVLEQKLASKHAHIRRDVLQILGGYKEHVKAAVIRGLLRDPSPEVRSQAIMVLTNLEDEDALGALVEACGDADAAVARQAAVAIHKIAKEDKVAEVVADLVELLGKKTGKAKAFVVEALARFKDKETVDVFAGLLDDEESSVRSESAKALGELNVKEGVQPLVDRLGEETESPVKIQICNALDRLKNRDLPVLEALVEKLEDDDIQVRVAAGRALGHLTGQEQLGTNKERWDEYIEKLKKKPGDDD